MSKRKPKKSSVPPKANRRKRSTPTTVQRPKSDAALAVDPTPSTPSTPLTPATPVFPGRLNLFPEALERLIAGAQSKQHPYGTVWQKLDLDAFNELAGNVDRRGLDQEILLYQGMVLEGWHRYLACLATKVTPKFIEFKGTDLEAAERVHASGIRRQSTPEQRYASFLLLCEKCPDFKAKYEPLKVKGLQQQQAGKPLSTDGQRVDVLGAKAKAEGVGRATAAKVEKVKKEKPEALSEIAAGKTSANTVLKEIKAKKGDKKPSSRKESASATADGRLLDELLGIAQSLEALLKTMERADWSKEDETKWIKAGEALSGAVAAIATKSQAGFSSAQNGAAQPQPKRPQAQPKEITGRKLKSLYGSHAVDVLDEEYLEELPRKEKAAQSYKVLKPLPSEEEFNELQKKRYTTTVADQVSTAFSILEDLANDVGEVYDNMPDSLRDGDRGSALDEAKSVLENLSPPDVNERIGALEVCYLPALNISSRSDRRNDATGRLQAVIDALGSAKESAVEDDKAEIQALIDELENAVSEADEVYFPGMYG